jgi:hypothetical protein
MEASTTIRQMLRGNEISVPGYQRAYSWDSRDDDRDIKTQTDVFLAGIKQHIGNNVQTQYYLGHFLFEKIQSPVLGRPSNRFYVIDGQQRLTTIVILMSAVNLIIKNLYNDGNARSDDEIELFEDIVKRNNVYRLSTVHYDDFFFRGYVINQDTSDKSRLTLVRAAVRPFVRSRVCLRLPSGSLAIWPGRGDLVSGRAEALDHGATWLEIFNHFYAPCETSC